MNRILLLGLITLAAFADMSHAKFCPPDQWQGFYHWKSLRLKPEPYYGEIITHTFSDAKNLKQAAFVNLTTGHGGVEVFYVYLYNKTGKGVTVFELNTQTKECRKWIEASDSFDNGCLPADAKNLGNSFLGVNGQSINVTDYSFEDHPHKTPTVITVTKVGSNFVPVRQTSLDGMTYEFTDVVFYNYTIGIQDPAIFDIPKPCQQGLVDHPARRPLVKKLLRRFPFTL